MMGILRRLETEELEKVLETIDTNSKLNPYKLKKILTKKGYEVEVCQEYKKLYPSEDGKVEMVIQSVMVVSKMLRVV